MSVSWTFWVEDGLHVASGKTKQDTKYVYWQHCPYRVLQRVLEALLLEYFVVTVHCFTITIINSILRDSIVIAKCDLRHSVYSNIYVHRRTAYSHRNPF